jgi:hypothetical protein
VYCQDCGKYYCFLHGEPLVHECALVQEEHLLTQQFRMLHRQGEPNQPVNYVERGRVDGCYTWYHPNTVSSEGITTQTEKNKDKINFKAFKGTITLLVLIMVFTLISIDFWIRPYLSLSAYGLSIYYFWTFFTSLFVITIKGGAGILFFIISLFFAYKIMCDLEKEHGIKFLFSLYCFSGLFSGTLYLVFRFLLSFSMSINLLDKYIFSVGLSGSALLGLISFKVFTNPGGDWSLYLYGLHLKMKGKSLLWILGLLRVFTGIWYGYYDTLIILTYWFELFGILAGYIVFRHKNMKNA